MTDRAEIEARLLKEPFNSDLRLEYAELLRNQGAAELALEQFRLIGQQSSDHVQARYGEARCLLSLGRRDEAIDAYTLAKRCPGFEPQTDLEQLATTRTAASRFSVVEGMRDEAVVNLKDARQEKSGFADVAGMEDLKKTLRLQIIEPFLHPGLFSKFKKKTGGGVLLYGPPGCGKTLMARAVATECQADFLSVGISDVLNMWLGESERNLSTLFQDARSRKPCVMFFDELDALAYSRSKAVSEHTRTVVNEFLTQLDGFDNQNEAVLIIAATNMPWDVDPAMKRPGRFDKQVFVPPPDAAAREAMLELKLHDVPTQGIDCRGVAARIQQFSGADIDGLIEQAKEYVLEDILATREERKIMQDDLLRASEQIVPSTMEWLRTARNLVKYGGGDRSYRAVEKYLKEVKLL